MPLVLPLLLRLWSLSGLLYWGIGPGAQDSPMVSLLVPQLPAPMSSWPWYRETSESGVHGN